MKINKIWFVGIIVVIMGISIAWAVHVYTRPIVPAFIRSQMPSVILIPSGENIVVDRHSMAISHPPGQSDSVLNFNVTIDEVKLLVGEQPTPQQFVDIPKIYDKVVEQSKPYGSFDTVVGTVHLTRPQSKQIAMLNSKGTYMLVQASKDLTIDQWRRLFRDIRLVQ